MEKFFGAARKAISDVGSLFQEAAHDTVYDVRDNALRGFGLPKFVSSVASFSVAGCAALGTLAVTSELVSKVHVEKECRTCYGWGGLRCKMCQGTGHVQYSIPSLSKIGKSSVEDVASDLLEGKEEVINYPAGYNAGYPLPYKKCPVCCGTGVSTCHDCGGVDFGSRFTLDNLMDVPWKNWDIHRKTCKPFEERVIHETVKDPAVAAFLLYERDELENGVKYDDEVKARLMASYQAHREYDEIWHRVAERQPGWEQLQEVLYSIDPDRARRDPVIIQDIPYYKALKAVEAEIESLEVPPRPAEWTQKNEVLLRNLHIEDIEDKKVLSHEEIRSLIDIRNDLKEEVLNAAWAKEWRENKLKEAVKEKINVYVEEDESGKMREKQKERAAELQAEEKASALKKPPPPKAAPKKVDKSQKADKKKERQERLAKQAAEREAALSKAKKT